MNARFYKSQAGIALIVVMIAVTVLSILVAGFAYSMKVETKLAQNANSETELIWLGRSGVEAARWILALSMSNPYDSLDQKWAGGPGGMTETNGPLAEVSLAPFQVGGRTYPFSIKIEDLDRKAKINRDPNDPATRVMLERALQVVGVDPGDSSGVTGSILDWIDPDNSPHVGGTESDYYRGFNPPYSAKNGWIDDLSELLLVRGVTPEIYWGGVVTNHQQAAFQRKLGRFGPGFEAMVYPAGLSELFTPISGGRININTASAKVLQLIPGVDEVIADAIVRGREPYYDSSGLMGLTGPYRSPGDAGRMPEVNNPHLIGLLNQFCAVKSSCFEVQVDADVTGYKRTFYAILARTNPRDVQVLSFYWKE